MSDQQPPEPADDATAELPEDTAPEPTPPAAPADTAAAGAVPAAPAAAPTTPWRDRVLGARGVAAVAAASLLIGGLGGFVLGRVGQHDRDDWRQGGPGWHGPGWHGPGGQFGPRGRLGPPGGDGGRGGWGQGQRQTHPQGPGWGGDEDRQGQTPG